MSVSPSLFITCLTALLKDEPTKSRSDTAIEKGESNDW